MNLGIYLGSFDPIHNGHIHLAKEVLEEFNLDRLLILPLNDAPHKKTLKLMANERFQLVQEACKSLDKIQASDLEIRHQIMGYSIRMIEIIQEAYPNDSLYYILGSDVFDNVLKWKTIDQLKDLVTFIVVLRHSETQEKTIQVMNTLKAMQANVFLSQVKPLNISSTQIKTLLKKGENIEPYVPIEIHERILNLYMKSL